MNVVLAVDAYKLRTKGQPMLGTWSQKESQSGLRMSDFSGVVLTNKGEFSLLSWLVLAGPLCTANFCPTKAMHAINWKTTPFAFLTAACACIGVYVTGYDKLFNIADDTSDEWAELACLADDKLRPHYCLFLNGSWNLKSDRENLGCENLLSSAEFRGKLIKLLRTWMADPVQPAFGKMLKASSYGNEELAMTKHKDRVTTWLMQSRFQVICHKKGKGLWDASSPQPTPLALSRPGACDSPFRPEQPRHHRAGHWPGERRHRPLQHVFFARDQGHAVLLVVAPALGYHGRGGL